MNINIGDTQSVCDRHVLVVVYSLFWHHAAKPFCFEFLLILTPVLTLAVPLDRWCNG